MGISDWMRAFRALHERAKAGTLAGDDAAAYRAGCEELARALLAAQKRTPRADESALRALRVARAVQVDLSSATFQARATTLELGAGGFSTLLARPPPADEELRCAMKLPGGAPLEATLVVTEARQQPGTLRASFAFRTLADPERARLERLVIDTALEQIAA